MNTKLLIAAMLAGILAGLFPVPNILARVGLKK